MRGGRKRTLSKATGAASQKVSPKKAKQRGGGGRQEDQDWEEESERRTRKVKVDYRKLNEGDFTKAEKANTVEDDEDADAANDIDDFLDEDLSQDGEFMSPPVVPGRRRRSNRAGAGGKRRKKGAFSDDDDDWVDVQPETVTDFTYQMCKDQICVNCASELPAEAIDACPDVFEDRLGSRRLCDLIRVLVGQDIQPTFSGTHLCPSCLACLEEIRSCYLAFRRKADAFRDLREQGLKVQNADLMGLPNTEMVGGGVAAFTSLGKITLKIIDPSVGSFNAVSVGEDFGVPVSKVYRAAVLPASEIPPEAVAVGGSAEEAAEEPSGAPALDAAEASAQSIDPRHTQLFLSQEEFDSLETKRVSPGSGTLSLALDELEDVCAKLLLGYRIKEQFVIGRSVAAEFQKQIPGSVRPFTCSDCSASYQDLHTLSNHVHSVHAKDEDVARVPQEEGAVSADSDGTVTQQQQSVQVKSAPGRPKALTRTGETPTLEKPFQCQHCDKCFSEYLTLSTHVEHYHGFRRTCNVSGCSEELGSIQDFVSHYVRHADPTFEIPSDFKAKTKVVLPCPLCNISVQGLWKYSQHTFVHDVEARFVCPACGKRIIKVQNFKDHILRHQLSNDSQGLAPATMLQKHKSVNPAKEATSPLSSVHACPDCNKTFDNAGRLSAHRASHIPKEQWRSLCPECGAPFPSDARLKLHMANVHTKATLLCGQCGAGPFENRHSLQLHASAEHGGVGEGGMASATGASEVVVVDAGSVTAAEH